MAVYFTLHNIYDGVRINITIYAGISKEAILLSAQMDARGSTPGLMSPTDVVSDTRNPVARHLVVVVVG